MSLRPIDRFNAPKTTLQTQDLVQKEDLFSYSDLLTKSVVPVLYDFRVSISLLRKTSKLQDMSQK